MLGDAPKELLSDRGPPVIRRQASNGSNNSQKSITAKVYKQEEEITPTVVTPTPLATVASPPASTAVSKTLQDKPPYPFEGEILPIESFERSKKAKEEAATACVPGVNVWTTPAALLQCGGFESRDDMESYLDETATAETGQGPPDQIELTMDDPLMKDQLLMQQQLMLQHRRKLGLSSPLARIGSSIRGGLGKSNKKVNRNVSKPVEETVKDEDKMKVSTKPASTKRTSTLPKNLPTSSKVPPLQDQIDSKPKPGNKKGQKNQGGWIHTRQEAKLQKRKEVQQKKLRKKQVKELKREKKQGLASSKQKSEPAAPSNQSRGRAKSNAHEQRYEEEAIDIGHGRTRSIERRSRPSRGREGATEDMERTRSTKSVERSRSTKQRNRNARMQRQTDPAEISARPARKRTVIIPDDGDELGIVPHYGPRKSDRLSSPRRSKRQPAKSKPDLQTGMGTF